VLALLGCLTGLGLAYLLGPRWHVARRKLVRLGSKNGSHEGSRILFCSLRQGLLGAQGLYARRGGLLCGKKLEQIKVLLVFGLRTQVLKNVAWRDSAELPAEGDSQIAPIDIVRHYKVRKSSFRHDRNDVVLEHRFARGDGAGVVFVR